ncbi:hypothetical protein [Natronobeatus ordinarius]|uniref:hypothetical protein n=1 Tax=Natronobeatus ordinarius TaxID=2963433 RepID=UPI0020CD35EA|nr:hypothetical protein [Natronobeatus ordinarius]
MSDLPTTTYTADRIDSSLGALSPTTRSAVRESVRRRTDLPAALVRTVGSAVGESRDGSLLEVATAVSFLGAYAEVRADLLGPESERYVTPRERDGAVLASDYLHASAHQALARASLPAGRHRSCYRLLTEGSKSLVERLFAQTDAAGSSRHQLSPNARRPSPRAVLVGTGGALGAAAGGASDEVIDAMRRYGESLATAAEAASVDTAESFEKLSAALDDRSLVAVAEPRSLPRDGAVDPVADPLERARRLLRELPDSPARERLERATDLLVIGTERSNE